MRAVICPVCNGTGKSYIAPPVGDYGTCHGCDGKGWVEVHEEADIYQYYPPQTTSPQYYRYTWPWVRDTRFGKE